ncbi:hypothetical protein NEOLI_004419 [Neolecta irregularis DAH-3]|uniref:Uncharacterized protein n=1 Tax=Neolecta irregularis (strain DAH-3) TaxID=1198029 RepID=A0A1U7LLR8_NEOID|nr:hypothetical protein NEOLI_004419 [Neolecta irregularis DAH-3]|eukprot:OLL23605.1 hypothetical protein NEOLI_004419 [Neolecta irregularis DAH-3]
MSVILDGCEQLHKAFVSLQYGACQTRRQNLKQSFDFLHWIINPTQPQQDALKIIAALTPNTFCKSPATWAYLTFLPLVRPLPKKSNYNRPIKNEDVSLKGNLDIPASASLSLSYHSAIDRTVLNHQTIWGSSTFDPRHEMNESHDLGNGNTPTPRPSKRERPTKIQLVTSEEHTLNGILHRKRLKKSISTKSSTPTKYETVPSTDNQGTPGPIMSGNIIQIDKTNPVPTVETRVNKLPSCDSNFDSGTAETSLLLTSFENLPNFLQFDRIKSTVPIDFRVAPSADIHPKATRLVENPVAKLQAVSPFNSLDCYSDQLQPQIISRNEDTSVPPQDSSSMVRSHHANDLENLPFPSSEASPSPGLETSENAILSSSADKWDEEDQLFFLHDKVSLFK